jgi:hypothetical protein
VYDEYGTFWNELLLIGNIVLDNRIPPRSYHNTLTYSNADFSPGSTVYIVYNVNMYITFVGRDNDDGTFRENLAFEMIFDGSEGFLMSRFGLTYDA